VVLCQGQPYTLTGITPASIALAKIQPLEPCGSKGSIVSSPEGVVYASLNGLIQITPYGGQNVTVNMIGKEDFSKYLNIYNLHAAWFMNSYLSFAGVADNVFQLDAFQNDAFQYNDYTGTYDGSLINFKDPRLGFIWIKHSNLPTYNVMQDIWTGEVFVIRNGQVIWLDVRSPSPRLNYVWRSKQFQLPFKENYAAARVFFQTAQGFTPSEDTWFRLYADGNLKFQEKLYDYRKTFRLPSGYKADFLQFELEGQLDILNVQVGKSARDLRKV